MRFFFLILLTLLVRVSPLYSSGEPLGLRVPEGFSVTEYASSDLANDIYTMTIDPKGRVVVAGRGFIRILIDENNDGSADRSLQFADSPRDGAMGLLWEGDTLYVTGDGGLQKFRDIDGDDRADGPPQLIRKMATGGEHASHCIRRGPDGWLYVLCGNMSRINNGFAELPTSPIKDLTAGCVLRFSPDLKKSEIVAHGFRNAYGMDFNPEGDLFAYDSDNERCVALPWYEPTRFYHVMPGRFYGWLSPQHADWWRCPPHFLDVVAPVANLNRGSPTGVACYRHTQFPEKYHGGMFALDWTFGKVYFLQLQKQGSSYSAKTEVFLETVGDAGFAPTGAAVHPKTGDLFISIGGRGTRGAVYRIRHNARFAKKKNQTIPMRSTTLDWHAQAKSSLLKSIRANDPYSRRKSLELIHRHAKHFSPEEFYQTISMNWDSEDRYLRLVCADLIGVLPQSWQSKLQPRSENEIISYCLAHADNNGNKVIDTLMTWQEKSQTPLTNTHLRLLQMALGDVVSPKYRNHVWAGYTPRKELSSIRKSLGRNRLEALTSLLRQAYKTSAAKMEVLRLLAMLEVEMEEQQFWLPLGRSLNIDARTHALICHSRMNINKAQDTSRILAEHLAKLGYKISQDQVNTDRHWPLRMRELYRQLRQQSPDLGTALVASPFFWRATNNFIYASETGFPRVEFAEKLLRNHDEIPDFQWTPEMVRALDTLPTKKILPLLRNLYGEAGVDDAILAILARSPQPEDRGKFLTGLRQANLGVLRSCLQSLQKLSNESEPEEILEVITSWRRLQEKEAKSLNADYLALLQHWTPANKAKSRQDWLTWFAENHPTLAQSLTLVDGVDLSRWQARLQQIDWANANDERGKKIFVKANCATCHSRAGALGPDLQGVSKRFSRMDRLTAIVQPSRDISPRYQASLVVTKDGKTYTGLVIYQATDGLILQTGPTTTVRIAGDAIETQQRTTTSIMPAGLLDQLSDRDIADLDAYLCTLGVTTSQQRKPSK